MAQYSQSWLISLSLAILMVFALVDATSARPPLQRRAGLQPSVTGSLYPMSTGQSTYPRASFRSDGTILGAYTAIANGETIITLTSSSDSGATWSVLGTAARGPANTTDIDNPYPIELPSGRLLVAYRSHDQTAGVEDAWTYYRLIVSYSDDGGANWDYLSTPAQEPGPTTGVWEPFMRMADDGETLQLYYSRETTDIDQDSLIKTSTDGGKTWSEARTFTGLNLTKNRDGMLGVAKTNDEGGLIAVFETETDGSNFHIGAVSSSDDGLTWTDRRIVHETESNNSAPQVTNVGGTLVVSFQTNEDGDYAVKVVTSKDGKNWGDKTTVMTATSKWAGLLTLDDSSFLVMAGHNGVASAQKVILA
ncbi:glycoside hydrolase family 93 protein [Aplosporella prunicola CBS 121167]|uniref:Glycoside hydrolase family 93 protein n=1 Tax=Aplosporella prunicola CBS 121167 TaxID=1176127 RepID=A0A6A6B3C0_9PEZI|nr:glycoside hydrolase family 93 protein [Aplosporella prunicola CBS 121167]KAF2137755.1 glycoside hydrolase family 93 protein [Aplosporella prunicola CBS 121167]